MLATATRTGEKRVLYPTIQIFPLSRLIRRESFDLFALAEVALYGSVRED
jgi:hypothetical protein